MSEIRDEAIVFLGETVGTIIEAFEEAFNLFPASSPSTRHNNTDPTERSSGGCQCPGRCCCH